MSQKTHNDASPKSDYTESTAGRSWFTFCAAFIFLIILWLVFSGKFDAFHVTLGIISCAIVAWASGDLLFSAPARPGMVLLWFRFLKYCPWLLYQIFLANLHVMYLVFHPRMLELIDPHIIHFDSRLTSNVSRTVLANAITLTPGTITLRVSAIGHFEVHCIDKKSGESLPGEMEQRVAEVFNE